MIFEFDADRDFELWLNKLRTDYGEDFEYLNGFHKKQLDYSSFIDGFVDKNVADATIDSSANVSHKDIRSLLSEKTKPHDKIIGFNKLFFEMKKKYGLKIARKWLSEEYSGGYYMHNAHVISYIPYCWAASLDRLAEEGLFFIKNYNNESAAHLTTFVDDLIEYISFYSNRSSGAVGVPNLLVWTYYFWKKDVKDDYIYKSRDAEYYAKQAFQKIIYRLNQPFMRIRSKLGQCA